MPLRDTVPVDPDYLSLTTTAEMTNDDRPLQIRPACHSLALMMRRPALLLLLCLEVVTFCPPQGPAGHAALVRSLLPACQTAGPEVAHPPRVSRIAFLAADPFGQSRKQPRAAIRTYCPVQP